MLVCEQIMERVARAVGRPVEEVKALNMYQVGWSRAGAIAHGLAMGQRAKTPSAANATSAAHRRSGATKGPAKPPRTARPRPQDGDVAPFGQRLDGCQARRCWEEVLASSDFAARRAAVAEHNAGALAGWVRSSGLGNVECGCGRGCTSSAACRRCVASAPPPPCCPAAHRSRSRGLAVAPAKRGPPLHLQSCPAMCPAPLLAEHRFRKRGIAAVATKFGISFTTKFLNQAGALVHIYTGDRHSHTAFQCLQA